MICSFFDETLCQIGDGGDSTSHGVCRLIDDRGIGCDSISLVGGGLVDNRGVSVDSIVDGDSIRGSVGSLVDNRVVGSRQRGGGFCRTRPRFSQLRFYCIIKCMPGSEDIYNCVDLLQRCTSQIIVQLPYDTCNCLYEIVPFRFSRLPVGEEQDHREFAL